MSEITAAMMADVELQEATKAWIKALSKHKYAYQFNWMGRPIIQTPQDIVAMQEIILSTQPDLIIETGIAHGGSLILSASMLELLGNDGQVVGVDVDIREHNRSAIEAHPMFKRITLLQGSSVDADIISQIRKLAEGKKRVMVTLDSNHTHEHVLQELELYAPFVTPDCYLVVLDTLIEDMPEDSFPDRPWGKGNNPKTAVWEFISQHPEFVIDHGIDQKLLLTSAPDGFLRRVNHDVQAD